MKRMLLRVGLLVFLVVAALAAFQPGSGQLHQRLFSLTGEEQTLAQVRGLGHLASDLIRPRLHLQPETPIAHNGVNPYGINTFLQQEVEPAKRERQVQLIAAAGFHWLRQEFPWYDLEISGRGNFEDCRHGDCISAWDKYDQIVSLAEQYGLQLLVRLSSPPEWSRSDGTARGPFAPPDNFDDFAAYAAAVAQRYRGRVTYYQVWNEPNIYNEWGDQPVDPEAYTRLLCATYQRLKQVDPGLVVVSGVLAPTIELGALNESGGNNLNDFIYLERMYAAGAGGCFDVMSVQGYGLYSGPTDRRMRPIIVNYGRNQFIRDIMVRHGDGDKAIWIAEMNWNAVPADSGIVPHFGRVTEAQQARYAPLAYQRAQQDWPWVGANFFWFFKRADDSEQTQAWYYFRMVEPDFTLLPVYETMRAHTRQPAVMYPGWFQEDHWAVHWDGAWQTGSDARATLGSVRAGGPGSALRFNFEGSELVLVLLPGAQASSLDVRLNGRPPRTFELAAGPADQPVHLRVLSGLSNGPHSVEIISRGDYAGIDGFIVRRPPDRTAALLLGLAAVLGLAWLAGSRMANHGGART
jgi:polysaccharide biosynthesis protein PslG